MKKCTKCGIEKDFCFFYKSKKGKNGLQSICKDCNASYHKKYNIKNREKIKIYQSEYRKLNPNKAIEYRLLYVDKIKTWQKKYIKSDKGDKKLREARRSLSNGYLRTLLRGVGWPKEAISPELIIVYRKFLLLTRKLNKNEK